jgi:hypothetical protein
MYVSLDVATANSSFLGYGMLRVHIPCIPSFLYNRVLESEVLSLKFSDTVCPQSPFGVLKNCGAQTN